MFNKLLTKFNICPVCKHNYKGQILETISEDGLQYLVCPECQSLIPIKSGKDIVYDGSRQIVKGVLIGD